MAEAHQESLEVSALSDAHQAHDTACVERLLAKHRPYLCRVVAARMNPRLARRADASDVVQEAQLEAARRIGDFLRDPRVPVKIWLRKLVVERLIMAERKHLHAQRRAVDQEKNYLGSGSGACLQLPGRTATPSHVVSRQETAAALRGALDALQESDREIIVLHLYEGCTSQESAAVLGIEPAAARKRLGRAVQRLRGILDARGLGASSL